MNIIEAFNELDKASTKKSLTEGCWKAPYSTKEANELKELFKNKIPLNRVGDILEGDDKSNYIDLHIGDDTLFDMLSVERKANPDGDARPTIRAWLRDNIVGHWDEYDPYNKETDPQTGTPFTEEAMNAIMSIVDGKEFIPPHPFVKKESLKEAFLDYKKYPQAPDNEYTKQGEEIVKRNDLGVVNTQISPIAEGSEDGVYIFEVNGGKNGSGDTLDYLKDIRNCIKDLRSVFRYSTYLLDYEFDAPDDLFYAHIGCMPRELQPDERLVLEERLLPKTGASKRLNEDLIVYDGEDGIKDCENIVKAYNDTKDINTKKCLAKALATAMFQTYSVFGDTETPKIKEWRETRWKELSDISKQWSKELYPAEFAKEQKEENK